MHISLMWGPWVFYIYTADHLHLTCAAFADFMLAIMTRYSVRYIQERKRSYGVSIYVCTQIRTKVEAAAYKTIGWI